MEDERPRGGGKRAETCSRILEAAIVCFGRCGYAGTSIRMIAGQADVAVGLINTYYASKDNLLAEAYRHAVSRVYSYPEEPLTVGQRLTLLVQQTRDAQEALPDYFQFFRMLLNTWDLPESYTAARRELFHTVSLYTMLQEAQERNALPQGDVYNLFHAFLTMMVNQLEVMKQYTIAQADAYTLATGFISHAIARRDDPPVQTKEV